MDASLATDRAHRRGSPARRDRGAHRARAAARRRAVRSRKHPTARRRGVASRRIRSLRARGHAVTQQPDAVRERLARGEAAFGTMAFEFFTPGLFAIAGQAGADFIILDTEHSGVGPDTIKAQIAAARGTNVEPYVRVPGNAHHLIAPILDAGALGVMVPLVETREQAEAIVPAARYRPLGRRGLAFSVAHDDYSGGEITPKIARANARTLVIALIES